MSSVLPVATETAPRRNPAWRKLLRWEVLLALVVLADFLFNARISKYFLDPWTLSDASFNFTERAIVALPMALLIIAGEIDISVGSTMALCSVVMGEVAAASWRAASTRCWSPSSACRRSLPPSVPSASTAASPMPSWGMAC
jgi:ribose/xylose/arabinose/galactoside ABC-type transport system permease subunit